MLGEAVGGLSAFKTMFDMTKALKDIHDVAIRDRAVIELQKEILSAQTQQAALIERIGQLEKEVAGFETWNAEKQRYELKDFGGETFAYALKPDAAKGEPPHRICPACYQNRHKSILQNQGGIFSGRSKMRCVVCEKDFFLGQYVSRS